MATGPGCPVPALQAPPAPPAALTQPRPAAQQAPPSGSQLTEPPALLCLPHSPFQVNKEKHELRGQLLALQGRPTEAVQEASFLGAERELEMRERLGRPAAGPGAGGKADAGEAAGPAGGKKEL